MSAEQSQPIENRVTPDIEKFRVRLSSALDSRLVFPIETYSFQQIGPEGEVVDALSEAERLATEEERGVVYVYNHFSRDDPFRAQVAVYLTSDVLRSIPIKVPIEMRQFESFKWVLSPTGKRTDTELFPLVISDSIEKYGVKQEDGTKKYVSKKGEVLAEGAGVRSYIRATSNAVVRGESALIPINPGRRNNLYEDVPRQIPRGERGYTPQPLDLFDAAVGKNPERAAKVAVVFIGMGIQGAEEYKEGETNKFNWRKKVDVVIGPTVRLEDLRQEADIFDAHVDEVGRNYLSVVVPDAYGNILNPPTP